MADLFPVQYSFLIPLLPLVGAAIAGLLGARVLRQRSHWPIWLGVGASAVLSFWILIALAGQVARAQHATSIRPVAAPGGVAHSEPGERTAAAASAESPVVAVNAHWYTWIQAGSFRADAGAWIDPLTAVMLCVVTGVGFVIIVFSKGYMAGEDGYFRFFAYMGLFIFAMTILVLGNNFVMLYLGWEGVGLCSYLLIGYYYQRPAAREAAKKAFLVNRVGDFGFGLGIMLIFLIFGTVSYFGGGASSGAGVFERAADPYFIATLSPWKQQAIGWIPFLLMLGAFGKSAQFPLHVWLPDAMEGPTPVSALIHAATMVTAGVYMIVRCGALFYGNTLALLSVAAVGAFTALMAASIALRQFDLKKVFAYSTISQLGYMFVGVAALAPVAGIFHLVTHAFFKALLFLGCGVVMHAMLGELDMRKMSGLRRVLPRTRIVMFIGCCTLAGLPPFAAFFSKDEIIGAAWDLNVVLGAVMLFTAFITAYYTFRLYFRVFEGPELIPTAPPESQPDLTVADVHAHASEAAVSTQDTSGSGVDRHLEAGSAHAEQDAHADAHAGAHGAAHAQAHHNPEPMVMILPLAVLAIGSMLGGGLIYSHALGTFLSYSPSVQLGHQMAVAAAPAHAVEDAAFGIYPRATALGAPGEQPVLIPPMMIISTIIALAGVLLAYYFHLRNRAAGDALPVRFAGVSRALEAKFWIDEVYQGAIVQSLRRLGRLYWAIDRFVIDLAVGAVAWAPRLAAFVLKYTTQRGYVQGYALTMLLGIVVILLVIFHAFAGIR